MGNINCLINNASTFELDNIHNIEKKKMGISCKYKCMGSDFLNKTICKKLTKKNVCKYNQYC